MSNCPPFLGYIVEARAKRSTGYDQSSDQSTTPPVGTDANARSSTTHPGGEFRLRLAPPGKPSKRAFMRKTTMGDLIGDAKEFAKEMEQYLQLQRAADKAKRDADAKYDKLAAFLRADDENRKSVMPGNKFRAKDGTVVEWQVMAASLVRLAGVSEADVVALLKKAELEKYLRTTYNADAIKKDHPYGKTGSADELADLGLCYREPSHKLTIRPKKSK